MFRVEWLPLCLEKHASKGFLGPYFIACFQGCSSTEGLCGNVFRDGEIADSSNRIREGGAGGNARAGGVGTEGVEGTRSKETPARFVLTG